MLRRRPGDLKNQPASGKYDAAELREIILISHHSYCDEHHKAGLDSAVSTLVCLILLLMTTKESEEPFVCISK
jgi:hypothetical protein